MFQDSSRGGLGKYLGGPREVPGRPQGSFNEHSYFNSPSSLTSTQSVLSLHFKQLSSATFNLSNHLHRFKSTFNLFKKLNPITFVCRTFV